MTDYSVRLVRAAEVDLLEIYNFLAMRETVTVANEMLDGLEAICESLTSFPERGHLPPELERLGLSQFREVHLKPYRIIYEIHESTVFIHCVLDGRRDLQTLLARRLLRV